MEDRDERLTCEEKPSTRLDEYALGNMLFNHACLLPGEISGFCEREPTNCFGKACASKRSCTIPPNSTGSRGLASSTPDVHCCRGGHLLARFPDAHNWSILLEYPIPVVGKRIDAVLLANNLIIVIEAKTGASPTSAARQVDDYALNLACFHEYSKGRTIIPIVVADAPVASNTCNTMFDSLIERCRFSPTADLGAVLESACVQHFQGGEVRIDAEQWDQSRFRPIPPIIDAAVALYSEMNVFEIGHSCAAREDLEKQQVFWSRQFSKRNHSAERLSALLPVCLGLERPSWALTRCIGPKLRISHRSCREMGRW